MVDYMNKSDDWTVKWCCIAWLSVNEHAMICAYKYEWQWSDSVWHDYIYMIEWKVNEHVIWCMSCNLNDIWILIMEQGYWSLYGQ